MRATSRLGAFFARLRIECFEINRWPALASHLMAFFLGVVSLNQAQSRVDGPKGMARRTVLVRPSFAIEEQIKAQHLTAALDLIVQHKDGDLCRLNHGELMSTMIHGEIWVRVEGSDLLELGPLLKVLLGEKRRDLTLSPGQSALPLCSLQPKVSYDD